MSRRRHKKEAEAGLLYMNALIARVSLHPLPDDIERRMAEWARFTDHPENECDECRRVEPEGYDWLYSMAFAPFLDPEKVRTLEGGDKAFFARVGSGVLWMLRQRCESCARERPLERASAS